MNFTSVPLGSNHEQQGQQYINIRHERFHDEETLRGALSRLTVPGKHQATILAEFKDPRSHIFSDAGRSNLDGTRPSAINSTSPSTILESIAVFYEGKRLQMIIDRKIQTRPATSQYGEPEFHYQTYLCTYRPKQDCWQYNTVIDKTGTVLTVPEVEQGQIKNAVRNWLDTGRDSYSGVRSDTRSGNSMSNFRNRLLNLTNQTQSMGLGGSASTPAVTTERIVSQSDPSSSMSAGSPTLRNRSYR